MSGIIGGAGSRSGVIGTTELDYEEGTWSAELRGQIARATTPVIITDAQYIKTGRMVYVIASFENVTTTGASGQIQVVGLPFTADSATNAVPVLISLCNKLTFTSTSNPAFTLADTTMSGNEINYGGTSGDWAMVATTAVYLRVSATYITTGT